MSDPIDQDPLELCRAAMESFNRGDVEAMIEGCDPDVEWWPLRSDTEGPYRGHAGMRAWVEETSELFERSHASISEARWEGHAVLAEGRIDLRGKQSGAPIEIPVIWVFRLKGDKLIWGRAFTDRTQALAALG